MIMIVMTTVRCLWVTLKAAAKGELLFNKPVSDFAQGGSLNAPTFDGDEQQTL